MYFLNPWYFTRWISSLLITSHHFSSLSIIWKPVRTCFQIYPFTLRNLNFMSAFLHIFIMYVCIFFYDIKFTQIKMIVVIHLQHIFCSELCLWAWQLLFYCLSVPQSLFLPALFKWIWTLYTFCSYSAGTVSVEGPRKTLQEEMILIPGSSLLL